MAQRKRTTNNEQRMTGTSRTYMAHTVPGLEPVAIDELRARPGRIEVRETLRRFDERTSLVLFSTGRPVSELLSLRTVEDLFLLVLDAKDIPPNWRGVRVIRELVAQAGPRLEPAMRLISEVRRLRQGKIAFRVVARKAGEHAYRRVDVQRAVELGILDRFSSWRQVEEGGVELWASLVGR